MPKKLNRTAKPSSAGVTRSPEDQEFITILQERSINLSKTIQSLEKELMGPRNLQAAHDREVILKFLEDKTEDEFKAMEKGLDRRWRPLKDK